MAEHEDWTAADDARLRAALASLRSEVEATPLADVRFVKARGRALRRRRFLATSAAAAAAVIVAGGVGYAAWGPASDRAPVVPATSAARSATTAASSSTTSSSLDQPGVLPLASEWESTLDLPAGSVQVVQAKSLEGGVECADPLGRATLQQSVTQDSSPMSYAATYWQTGGDKDKTTALEQSVLSCQLGPDFTVKSEFVGDFALASYSAGGAGSGWFAVVSGGDGLALLQLIDPAFPNVAQGGFTKDEVGDLARLEQQRLDRYASGSTASTASSDGAKAVNEKMTVAGPDPVPSSTLFVAASQWSSDSLTAGAKTAAGPGALEGSTAVASCETDEQQAGIGGQVGVVSVRTGTGSSGYIGRQRVQLDDGTDATMRKSYVAARIKEAKALYAKGCDGANYTVKSTPGPTDGTYRLDTVFTDGSATLSEWVGVTAQRTPGAVSTVVITATTDPDQGFADLDRLLALARQK